MIVSFDSNEELYFSWYLETLKDNNLINHWEKVTDSINICDNKTYTFNGKPNPLIRELIYTSDFKIVRNN